MSYCSWHGSAASVGRCFNVTTSRLIILEIRFIASPQVLIVLTLAEIVRIPNLKWLLYLILLSNSKHFSYKEEDLVATKMTC